MLRKTAETTQQLLVSVIIPERNEAQHIRACLDAILDQDYPQDRLNVIVVDGQSTDGTVDIVNSYAERHSNLCLLTNSRRIVPTALNLGIRAAKGDIIVRVDGHTIIAPDYVSQCVAALQRTGADNVGGRMCAESSGYFGQAVALATSSRFGIGNSRFHYLDKEELVDSVYMGAYRRQVFSRVGLFDEEMVRDQDDEFNYRLRAHGGRIVLCPQIRSRYTTRDHPLKLWRQYFEYGYWKVRVLQKHPGQMSVRHYVPPAFVTALLGGSALALLGVRWPLGLVAGSYLLANLAVSVWTAARSKIAYLPVLPSIFIILHSAYGLGFLKGLVLFAGRWNVWKGKYVRSRE